MKRALVVLVVLCSSARAPRADEGRARLVDYQEGLTKFFNVNNERIEDAFRSELSIFKQCISNQRINLSVDVRAYELCPREGMLFRDFIVVE